MNKPLIVLTSPLPLDAEAFSGGRARLKIYRRKPQGEGALKYRLRAADGAVTLLSDPVTGPVLRACPRLKVVSNYAVGTDNIDLEEAGRLGIVVTNTPGVLTETTADLAWTLILAAARRVVEGDRMVRRGRFSGWKPDLLLGMDLAGKTLGIVGMGRIGRAVARRAPAFGMRVVYTQRQRLPASTEAALKAAFLPLDELIEAADVVSLHCPLTPETRRLLDRERLAAMKPGALLINTSRGPVVDEEALVDLLASGRLGGAGLDVYEREPALARGLASLPNAVLLPHLGSAGRETRAAMARAALSDCLAVLEGRPPAHPVA